MSRCKSTLERALKHREKVRRDKQLTVGAAMLGIRRLPMRDRLKVLWHLLTGIDPANVRASRYERIGIILMAVGLIGFALMGMTVTVLYWFR